MHLQLDSRPGIADVSADGLMLSFAGTPGLQVVGTLSGSLIDPRAAVVIEVLAASHRVHLSDDEGLLVTEQVACTGEVPAPPLPAAAAHAVRGHRIDFESSRSDLDGTRLADLAATLRTADTDHDVLVVSFPGHRDALTSVRLRADGWETWHLYPGDRPHAVRTRTTVTGP